MANGALRRVEDMRTEDFIQSAEKSAFHQLAESTVVKISTSQSSVIITFSYDKNRSKVSLIFKSWIIFLKLIRVYHEKKVHSLRAPY